MKKAVCQMIALSLLFTVSACVVKGSDGPTSVNASAVGTDVKNYKAIPVTAIDQITLKERASDLSKPYEILTYTLANGKAYLYVEEQQTLRSITKKIYEYDVTSKILEEIKTFQDDEYVQNIIAYEGGIIYTLCHQEQNDPLSTVQVIQEKDEKQTVLATLHIDNTQIHTPIFQVSKDRLYMLLTNTEKGEDQKFHMNQKLVSYHDGKLTTEIEKNCVYKDSFMQSSIVNGSCFLQAKITLHQDGRVLMQEFTNTGSVLHWKKDGKWKTTTLEEQNVYLVGYLGNKAIMYREKEAGYFYEDYYVLQLDSGEKSSFACDVAIGQGIQVQDNVMMFRDRSNQDWLLALQSDGTIKREQFTLADTLHLAS